MRGLNEGRGLQHLTSSAPPLTAGIVAQIATCGRMHAVEQIDIFAALQRGLRAEEKRDRVREFYARKSAEAKAAKANARRRTAHLQRIEKSRATQARVSHQPDYDTPPW